MHLRRWAGWAVALAVLFVVVPACHADFEYSLGAATFSPDGKTASFAVSGTYTDSAHTPPYEITFVSIDISASSAALAPVDPMTMQQDFSAFNFTPSAVIGPPGWSQLIPAPPGTFQYQTPPPPGTIPLAGLPPGSYMLGTLTYDLSKFGITPDPSLIVSIMGPNTLVGTQDPLDNTTFGFITPTFNPGQQPLDNGGGGGTVAPAPASFSLFAVGSLLMLVARGLRKRS